MAKKPHPEMRRFACGVVVKQLPTIAQIKDAFDVDLDGGFLLHKRLPGTEKWTERWNRESAGKPAGVNGTSYAHVKINGVGYQVHRLLWKVATGADPRGVIDHINGVRDDNRLINLRDVTPRTNAQNAINGRWAGEIARRAEAAEQDRKARIETRERELLSRLKAKYEKTEDVSISNPT